MIRQVFSRKSLRLKKLKIFKNQFLKIASSCKNKKQINIPRKNHPRIIEEVQKVHESKNVTKTVSKISVPLTSM